VGSYDLVFLRWESGVITGRQDVRIVLKPKGSGRLGPQGFIDTPSAEEQVGRSFVVGGWAADIGSGLDSGVAAVHVWAYPHVACDPGLCTGATWGAPIFVGAEATGIARPDVAAVHGDAYLHSGYGVAVESLPPGTYDLAVFAWSSVRHDFMPAKLVRVTVR
jgi:hypothetical protein